MQLKVGEAKDLLVTHKGKHEGDDDVNEKLLLQTTFASGDKESYTYDGQNRLITQKSINA